MKIRNQQNKLTYWQGPALQITSYKCYPTKHQQVSVLLIETVVQCFLQSLDQDQRAAWWKASKESRRLTTIFWTSLPWWSAFTFSFSRTTLRQIQRHWHWKHTPYHEWVFRDWMHLVFPLVIGVMLRTHQYTARFYGSRYHKIFLCEFKIFFVFQFIFYKWVFVAMSNIWIEPISVVHWVNKYFADILLFH